MISNFPFFPPFYGNSYRLPRTKWYMDTPNSNLNQPSNKYSKNYNPQSYHPYTKKNDNSSSTSPHNINNEFSESTRNKGSESLYNPNDYFEILGIRFHYDDILLICLIFFLYKEGVKDETLFIGLILLLLS